MRLTLDTLPMYCQDCGDCLLWRQGTNGKGHPQANLDGKPGTLVRRYVFSTLMGKQIPERGAVTTRCSNVLCVAPAHLIGMTRSKILFRAYETGRRMTAAEYLARLRNFERQGRTRLTREQVADIRSRPGSESHASLAREFGVHAKTVGKVRSGESWRMQMPTASVFELARAA